MNQRKKWATKEAAKEYVAKALKEGKTGLTFCAACDFLGWVPTEVIERHKENTKKAPLILLKKEIKE